MTEEAKPKKERSLYAQLASVGPYGPGIGSALITMVEPHAGQERAYNRWYENDQIYARSTAASDGG
jgi:hypothetical protein